MDMEDGMDESSSAEWESSSHSSSSSSSEDSSLGGSDNSSSSSEESSTPSSRLEDCKVDGTHLQLPQGLCEQEDVFQQLLSYETWQNLSAANKEHLKKFLPNFKSNNECEQDLALKALFGGENIRFGNPIKDFHRNLKNGFYRPDIARMRSLLKKALNKEYNYSQKRYYFRVMKSVLVSRQKLLQAACVLPPGMNPKVPRLQAPPRTQQLTIREYRTRRRYFQELRAVRQEVGESGHSSEDENYPEGPPAQMNKKLKRRLSVLETSLYPEMRRVVSTLASKPVGLDLAANVTASSNPYEISDEAYRNMLINHKKRRLTGDHHPELNTVGRTLEDIVDRSNRVLNKKGLLTTITKLESPQLSGKLLPKQVHRRRNSKVQQESFASSSSPLMMADSSNNSDMAESEDEDNISVTEDAEKPLKTHQDKKTLEKEKEFDVKGIERDRVWDKEKERERNEGERVMDHDLEKHSVTSKSKIPAVKVKKANASPRSTKLNNLSGLPTNRRLLKGELEDAVDNLLSSGPTTVKISQNNQKVAQNLTNHHPQSPRLPSQVQKHQVQIKEEDVGVQVVQTTSYPPSQDSSLLPDLSNIDMMSLPIDIEDSEPVINVEDLPATPSLMQDTHSCFFALLRNLICSAREQSMSLSTLQAGLRQWQDSPISPLNDWYSQADNSGGWVSSLTSALTFLSGQLPDMHPDEFVPYLEYKPSIRKYQWIGAGRDSDNLLMPLCTYWLERRDEAAEVHSRTSSHKQVSLSTDQELENIDVDDEELGEILGVESANEYFERLGSPPPSCNPTDWVVVPSTPREKEIFRAQELERFANPLRAFTYRMHGYESVVGPLRGLYSTGIGNVKPRGHSLLVSERPNYVTILALVRDAVARLPNGQGTRMEICELLKDSQYVKPGVTDSLIQSVVSGALDRLHYKSDPCVKFDTKRKIWIHLHRARTMEEYEQMHQQQQGMGKIKYQRKSSSRMKKDRDSKAETKAAVAAVTPPKLLPPVEAEIKPRPSVSLSSGSLWNTPMELPLLSNVTSSATSNTSSLSSITTTSSVSTQSPRTLLAPRVHASSAVGRKSAKKQMVMIDGVETVVPITVPGGSNPRSVLGSCVSDTTKATQQQVTAANRLVSSTSGRKSLVMTSSGGIQQVVQLSPASKQSVAGTSIAAQGTLLLNATPTTASVNTSGTVTTTSSTAVQWAAVSSSPSISQRQTGVMQQMQQISSKKGTETKRLLSKPAESIVHGNQALPGGVIQPGTQEANAQRQMKQQQQLLLLKRQQQQQLQAQLQLQQQQQLQQQLQVIQPQEQPQTFESDRLLQNLELDQKQREEHQKQQMQAQQKVGLSVTPKQIQQQTIQLLQQQLKEKPGALSLSNIQLVDQSGTVMAVQSSESQASNRPRQNLVLVRQAGTDQANQLTAMVQKQQQLLLLKQKQQQQQQQQSMKDLSEAQQQQIQLRQRQVQELLKQQLKAQQTVKVQPQNAQTQLQQQIVVVSGSSQQQIKQQLVAQQKQAQAQLVVLKQPRGQGQLVNTVGGILPQQMFVVKTKPGSGQKQVLTQLTAEQQAGLLALQRQQQQQLQLQQQQQTQMPQQPPPLHLQTLPVTTTLAQNQLSDQGQQPRPQIQQVMPSQAKSVRGTSILGQGMLTSAGLTNTTVTSPSGKQGPPPMVAKVVTNSQGQQLITMEAFQAQGKGTVRVAPAGTKSGQTNQLIQIAGTGAGGISQFAVVSQGNIISLASSINAQRVVPQALTLSSGGGTTTAVTASKLAAGTVNAAVTQPSSNVRVVGNAGLNIAHIGGKPVLLASKQQSLQGQNVILTSPGGGQQTVLLASQSLRPTSSVTGVSNQPTVGAATSANAVVLQQAGGTQQILLPPGFQGGTINLKGIQGIQGLQGLKVIPVAQATQGDGTKGRSQMFARIISPSSMRAAATQQSAVAVAGAGTAGTTTVSATPAVAISSPAAASVSSNKE